MAEHQWKLKREYQFPNSRKTIIDETINPPIVGWVVNSLADKQSIYGVIRYFPGFPQDDRRAWLESDNFGSNGVEQAEQWLAAEMSNIGRGQAGETGAQPSE